MIELLEELKPLNPVIESPRLMMLEQFKAFMINYDMESLNRYSQNQYEDGLDYFFHTFNLMPTAREMHVIATILAWLNSNCGRSFLYEAENLSLMFNNRKLRGYVCAWAYEDHRMIGSNHGFTLMEYLLTPCEHHDFNRGLLCHINTYVSVTDQEIAKCLIAWLSTADGQEYLNICKSNGLFYEWYPLKSNKQAVQMNNVFIDVDFKEIEKECKAFESSVAEFSKNIVQQVMQSKNI